MLFFKRVHGTVKGGCDVELGPRTLITGVNGAGKSRIVNTAELAGSAEASDIVGRATVKRGLDLLAMAPPDGALIAEAELSNGQKCGLSVERGKKKGTGKQPVHTPPYGVQIVYPIREALAALRGNTKGARDFVLKVADLPVKIKSVKKVLDDDLHDVFDTFIATHQDKPSVIEQLQAVRTDAEKIARAANAGAKKADEIVDSLASSMPLEEPTDDQINAAKEAVGIAHTAYSRATQAPEVVDVAALKAAAVAAVEAYQTKEKARDTVKEVAARPENKVQGGRLSLLGLLDLYSGHEGAKCLLCEQGAVTGAKERAQTIRHEAKAEQDRQRAVAALPGLEAEVARLKNVAVHAIQTFKAHEHVEQPDPKARQQAIADSYKALKEAESALDQLTRAQAQWSTIKEARVRAKESKKQAKQAATLAEECAKILTVLTKKSKDVFVEKVQKHLPPEDQFDLVLKEGKREVCKFGFRRNDVLHTALSGAEWARLTIALGAACMPEGDGVLALLTPEERAFDPDTLQRVMEALDGAPGQVILTSPVGPTNPVKGWTHIVVE